MHLNRQIDGSGRTYSKHLIHVSVSSDALLRFFRIQNNLPAIICHLFEYLTCWAFHV
jgi:hypothetical protein